MWGIVERRGATTVELSSDQAALLQVTYDEFRKSSAWPTLYQVDRAFIRRRKKTTASASSVMRDLPDGLLMGNIRTFIGQQDLIMPTISGLARCVGSEEDLDSFLRAVRWCVRQEMKREPQPGETSVEVTRTQLKRAIPAAQRTETGSLDRLFRIITLHHWGCVQSSVPSDGSDWTLRLGPEVRRFRNASSVEAFIDARVSWHEEDQQLHASSPASDLALTQKSPARSYVNPKILNELRQTNGAAWDTVKLVALVEELEACMQAGHVFASHAVLRALLDHVPPLFGQSKFAGVANNHPWTRTDKSYLRKLNTFRDQGDDALHRQISKLPDLLMIDDMPQGAAVNALLRGCAAQLQQP